MKFGKKNKVKVKQGGITVMPFMIWKRIWKWCGGTCRRIREWLGIRGVWSTN